MLPKGGIPLRQHFGNMRHATLLHILGCERTGCDNASDKRQNCRLSLALSYLLECSIIFIRIWHIYWDMASYHIHWNMESYLLECGIIFIGMWHHIYWKMASPRTSLSQDVQTRSFVQLGFAKFLSKKGKFLIQCPFHGYSIASKISLYFR